MCSESINRFVLNIANLKQKITNLEFYIEEKNGVLALAKEVLAQAK